MQLNLEDNSLTELPTEDGIMNRALPEIRELNLNQNPFKSLDEVISVLKSLPRLISLYLSLYEE